MDYGSRYTDRREIILDRRLARVYREAQKDLQKKLDDFTKKMEKENQKKMAALKAGKITEEEYRNWLSLKVFQGQQWRDKVEIATETLLQSNRKAMTLIRDEQMNVFSENANFEAYTTEKAVPGASFELYDVASVDRLVREKPELLPRKTVNGRKDKAWNQGNIANVIAQGIIQGESIPKIARRMARDTAEKNKSAMIRYARTAMTGAQNAGRIETMHRTEDMGIKVRKQWLATLDGRTRDAHRMLDGQEQDVDKPFQSELGPIMYPGDPAAAPGNVYNCRCTLVSVYTDYSKKEFQGERREQTTGKMIQDMTYREWEEWKKAGKPVKPAAVQKTTITKEQYDEMKKNRGSLLEKEIAQANEWYDKQTDELMDRYGGSFVSQRISVKQDSSLTEAEKEKKLDEIEEKRLSYNEERNKLKEERDKKIKAAHDKHDYTFEPQYEYRSIEGKASTEKNAKEVNPNWSYDSFEYTHNCQRCGVAFELRERGFDVEACGAPSGGYESEIRWLFSEAETVEISGRGHQNTIDVRNQMTEWGEGARAIISIQRDGMSGHIFNAEYKDGKFYLIDSQAGACWTDEQKGEEVDGGCLEGEWTNHVTLYRVDNVRMRMPREGWIKAR